MKKFLPSFSFFTTFGVVIFFVSFLFVLVGVNNTVSAADPTPSISAEGKWVQDPEVTFVGKTATRSDDFLNWTLQNYDWLCIKKDAGGNCNNTGNPLVDFWVIVRNTVYILMVVFILVTAFVMIITRGQNITIMKFIPRFVFIIVLVTLSFSAVQFIYQITDIIQGFLFRITEGGTTRLIGSSDLLHIAFDYVTFQGYRRVGDVYEESAFISLLLVRLTAFTYYTMTGILLIRKIILWFFIIVSPVFPLLLFYAPIRNTAKIWIGEFFRWLLYGPLFALFLHGLVQMWRSNAGIPLPFDFAKVGSDTDIIYPTAVNILLGGPGQALAINNSVNLRDTFALYVVALLMLWVVILLPFLLLNIFLDYLSSVSIRDNTVFKQLVSRSRNFLNPRYPNQPPPGSPPPAGAGMARAIPFLNKAASGIARTIPVGAEQQTTNQVFNVQNIHNTSDIMKLTNLAVPKMRDIARYESALISKDSSQKENISKVNTTLSHIANPTLVGNTADREKFSQLKERLIQQKQKGDPLATSILSASSVINNSQSTSNVQQSSQQVVSMLEKIAHPEAIPVATERQKFIELKQQLVTASQQGDPVATSILSTSNTVSQKTTTTEQKTMLSEKVKDQLTREKNNPIVNKVLSANTQVKSTQTQANLPVVNRVQQVSLEDYEEVRKMWVDNYQSLEPPKGIDGKEVDRKTWIKNDIDRINQAVTLLTSVDSEKNKEGMNMVANILPFLLIGGFSRSEVIAYLKAKMEAGKSVMDTTSKKEEEEDTMVARDTQKQEQAGEMHEQRELPNPNDVKPEPKYLEDEKPDQQH